MINTSMVEGTPCSYDRATRPLIRSVYDHIINGKKNLNKVRCLWLRLSPIGDFTERTLIPPVSSKVRDIFSNRCAGSAH